MKLRALCCMLAVGGTASAREDFITARLAWQRAPGAEDCMSAEALRRSVASRLKRDPFTDAAEDVVLEGRVAPEADAGGWVVELELRAPDGSAIGSRTLRTEAEHCSALDDSLPLVVALMLDVPREELLPPAPPTAPAPLRPRTAVSLPRETHAPREPWRFQTAALATGAVGFLPGIGLGAGATIGVEPPTFWLTELDIVGWLPADAEEAGGGARFRVVTVGLHFCPLSLESDPLRLDFCAGQRIGRIDAEGFGFDRNREQVRLSYSLGARARAWATIAGPLRLGLGAGAEAPLTRDEFYFSAGNRDETELFRTTPVVGAAETLIGVSLP